MEIRTFVALLAILLAGFAVAAWMLAGGGGRREAVSPGSAVGPPQGGSERVVTASSGRRGAGGERGSARALGAAPAPRAGATALGAAPGARGREVHGRVLDGRGRALMGAEVTVRQGRAAPGKGVGNPLGGGIFSAQDGSFTLPGVRPGPLRLSVRAAGHAPLDRGGLVVPTGGDLDVGDLVLADGVILQGRVLDDVGSPVHLAAILREAGEELALHAGGDPTPLTATDAQGRFRIEHLAVGSWRLRVTHPDHPDGVFAGETAAPGVALEVELRVGAGARISGRAIGEPSPEARQGLEVIALPHSLSSTRFGAAVDWDRPEPRRAQLAGDGTFELSGLRPGEHYRLRLLEGEEPRSRFVAAEAGDTDVALEWAAGMTLLLRAVDAVTREPIDEVVVRHGTFGPRDPDASAPPQGVGGRVQLGGLRPSPGAGAYHVELMAEGYGARGLRPEGLSIGEVRDLGDIALARRPLLHVTVLDEGTGAVVGGAQVHLIASGQRDGASGSAVERRRRSALTDERGGARVTRPEGAGATLLVVAGGYAPHIELDAVFPTAGEVALEVLLGRGAAARVRVVDASGSPVPGAQVEHLRGQEVHDSWASVFATVAQVSDAEGRARFGNLEAGVHRFRAVLPPAQGSSASGGRASEGAWVRATLPREGAVDVSLEVRTGATLTGVVRAAGWPAAGARVELIAPGAITGDRLEAGPAATTGTDGAFRLERTEIGTHQLIVTLAARAMDHRQEVVVRREGVHIEIDLPVTSVAGRVTVDGEPVDGVQVRARREADAPAGLSAVVMLDGSGAVYTLEGAGASVVVTDSDGRYTLSGLAPGAPLVVTFEASYLVRGRLAVASLAPGDERGGVDIDLRRAGSLRVTAVRANGVPLGYSLVTAVPGDAPGGERATVFLGGDATTLTGLAPGSWEVTLQPAGGPGAGFQSETVSVDVVAGETAELTFTPSES